MKEIVHAENDWNHMTGDNMWKGATQKVTWEDEAATKVKVKSGLFAEF